MTLVLRRIGRGNWSKLLVSYDPARQGQLPTLMHARVGQRVALDGVMYRVSRVMP